MSKYQHSNAACQHWVLHSVSDITRCMVPLAIVVRIRKLDYRLSQFPLFYDIWNFASYPADRNHVSILKKSPKEMKMEYLLSYYFTENNVTFIDFIPLFYPHRFYCVIKILSPLYVCDFVKCSLGVRVWWSRMPFVVLPSLLGSTGNLSMI